MPICFSFSIGKEHGCKRSQGDMAHLQEHQAGEEDGPRQSQEASEEIPASHSPVRKVSVRFSFSCQCVVVSSSGRV